MSLMATVSCSSLFCTDFTGKMMGAVHLCFGVFCTFRINWITLTQASTDATQLPEAAQQNIMKLRVKKRTAHRFSRTALFHWKDSFELQPLANSDHPKA
jgi:truncated hemoglobin YjbI